jgi:hypothetical protein
VGFADGPEAELLRPERLALADGDLQVARQIEDPVGVRAVLTGWELAADLEAERLRAARRVGDRGIEPRADTAGGRPGHLEIRGDLRSVHRAPETGADGERAVRIEGHRRCRRRDLVDALHRL